MMLQPTSNMAERVAQAAIAFQPQLTGHKPKSVSVVIGGETLVITLRGALSPAEQAMAQSPAAANVRELHRKMFFASSETLRQAIQRITGLVVLENASEVFLESGTMVQVFLLSGKVPSGSFDGGSTT
jgi:uncharacterized protein YbcI